MSALDTVSLDGNVLTLHQRNRAPVSIRAQDVVAIWYDYNPFGWMHANSVRLVHKADDRTTQTHVFDEEHTFEPLLSWLAQHFPAPVADRYRKLWGGPGGDEPSIQLWASPGN